jgi:hypothetical protein
MLLFVFSFNLQELSKKIAGKNDRRENAGPDIAPAEKR